MSAPPPGIEQTARRLRADLARGSAGDGCLVSSSKFTRRDEAAATRRCRAGFLTICGMPEGPPITAFEQKACRPMRPGQSALARPVTSFATIVNGIGQSLLARFSKLLIGRGPSGLIFVNGRVPTVGLRPGDGSDPAGATCSSQPILRPNKKNHRPQAADATRTGGGRHVNRLVSRGS